MNFFRSGFFVASLLFTLLLAGLYSRIGVQAQGYKPVKVEKPVLVFEKKPCFGFCPVYEAKFFSNGNVLVTYTKPQQKAQKTNFKLAKTEIKALAERAEDLGVFQMKDKYETLKSDYQVRDFTYNKQFKSKTISYTEGGSLEFDTLLQDLASLVEQNIKVEFKPDQKL